MAENFEDDLNISQIDEEQKLEGGNFDNLNTRQNESACADMMHQDPSRDQVMSEDNANLK